MFAGDQGRESGARGVRGGAATPESDRILRQIRALRSAVIAAWSERAVMLTKEERAELRKEIAETCDLLKDLTAHP